MRRRRRLSTDIAAALLVVLPVLTAPGATADAAVTGLTDCRFSRAQVFDVQWNPGLDGNTLLRASSFTRPYSSHEPGGQLSLAQMADDDTFGFYENGSDIGFRQYAADGTLIRTLHLSGTFTAVGDDFIFYNGAGSWGTLITSGEGYAYGDSASLPVSDADVSLAEALAYTSCSATALAIGQTRAEVESDDEDDPTPTATPTSSGSTVRRDPDGELPTATACGAEAHDRRTLTPLEPALAGAQLTIPDHGLALAPVLMTVSGDIDRRADGCARAPVAPLLLTVEGPLPVEQVVEVWALSEPRLVAAARVVEADRLRLEIPLDAPLDAGPPLLPGLHVLQLQYTDGVAALTTNISIELFDPAAAATPIPTAVRTGGGPQGPLPIDTDPLLALALGLIGVAASLDGRRRLTKG